MAGLIRRAHSNERASDLSSVHIAKRIVVRKLSGSDALTEEIPLMSELFLNSFFVRKV